MGFVGNPRLIRAPAKPQPLPLQRNLIAFARKVTTDGEGGFRPSLPFTAGAVDTVTQCRLINAWLGGL